MPNVTIKDLNRCWRHMRKLILFGMCYQWEKLTFAFKEEPSWKKLVRYDAT